MGARRITMPGWREIGAGAVVDLHVERQAVHGGGMNRASVKRVKIGERLERDEGWVVADVRAPRGRARSYRLTLLPDGSMARLAGKHGALFSQYDVDRVVVVRPGAPPPAPRPLPEEPPESAPRVLTPAERVAAAERAAGAERAQADLAAIRVARGGAASLRGQELGRVWQTETRAEMAKRGAFGYHGRPVHRRWHAALPDGKPVPAATMLTRASAVRALYFAHKRAGTLPPPGGDWDDAGDRARLEVSQAVRESGESSERTAAARRHRARRIRFEGKLSFGSRRGSQAAKIKEAIMAGGEDGNIAIGLDAPTKNVTWYRWWLGKHGFNPPAGR